MTRLSSSDGGLVPDGTTCAPARDRDVRTASPSLAVGPFAPTADPAELTSDVVPAVGAPTAPPAEDSNPLEIRAVVPGQLVPASSAGVAPPNGVATAPRASSEVTPSPEGASSPSQGRRSNTDQGEPGGVAHGPSTPSTGRWTCTCSHTVMAHIDRWKQCVYCRCLEFAAPPAMNDAAAVRTSDGA